MIISGGAAMTRSALPGKRSLFAASKLGFAHFQIDEEGVRLRFYDADGVRVLFEKLYL
jgi:hypothetical protein